MAARNAISNIEKDVGITVQYEPPFTLHDGSPPTRKDYLITYDPLDLEHLPMVAQSLEKAVRPYPEGFLQKHCGLIFVAGSLKLSGNTAGGTYGPGWVIVNLQQEDRLSHEARSWAIQRAFHHECASQIYDNDAWATLAFAELWPNEIVPSQNVNDQPAFDPSIGFISAYSMSGSSNDFSEYVRFIFAEPEQIRDLALQHPKVQEKLEIVMASYERADPRFRDYFVAQGLAEADK